MTSTFRNIHFQCHQISANLCDMQRTQWPLTVRRKDVKKVKEQTWGIQPHLTNLGIISTFVLLKTKVKLSNYTARFALKLSWSLATATNRRERKITQSSFMIAVVVRALLKSTGKLVSWLTESRSESVIWHQARQPVCDFYLKHYVVCHWCHISHQKCAGNRRENNNRPIVK